MGCPKRTIIEKLAATEAYLLGNQLVEFTPTFRSQAILKVTNWMRDLEIAFEDVSTRSKPEENNRSFADKVWSNARDDDEDETNDPIVANLMMSQAFAPGSPAQPDVPLDGFSQP